MGGMGGMDYQPAGIYWLQVAAAKITGEGAISSADFGIS
jgi:hypothetical protein